MKNLKKILSIMMAICLVATFIPAMGIVAMAEETGVRIELTNTTVVFDGSTTSCNVPVAVKYSENVDEYTYEIPSVAAVYKDGAAVGYTKVDAQAVPGAITVTVEDTAYTLNLALAGVNLYADGGFENGVWPTYFAFLSQISDNPGKGNYSMNVKYSSPSSYWYPEPPVTVSANKNYLASSMVRFNEAYAGEDATIGEFIQRATGSGFTSILTNNAGTTTNYNADGTITNVDTTITDNWKTRYTAFVPNEEMTIVYSITDWGTAFNLDVDEYFLGELAAHINVVDGEGNEKSAISSPDADKVINLSADRVNQLGNKAGLGENPAFTWSLLEGNAGGVAVDATGAVTVKAGAPAGIYKVQAKAASGTDVQSDIKGIYVIEVSDKCSLSNLTVSNTDLDFDSAITEYSVPVPVLHKNGVDSYSWQMPVVEATAMNNDDEVEIEYPDSIPGNILVKVSDGEITKTYTIALDFAGKNLYADGGFENGVWPTYFAFLSQISDNPGKGNYSMNVKYSSPSSYWYPEPPVTVSANKNYLASSMVRFNEAYAGEDATIGEFIQRATGSGFTSILTNNAGTTTNYNADGTITNVDTTITDNWKTRYTAFVPNEEMTIVYSITDWGTAFNLDVDEYFLGELVIADVEFTADKDVVKSDEAQTVTLSAKAVNNLGNSAAIKDNCTLSLRLAADAPEGAAIENGVVTIPAGFEGTITVEAVATPTWENAVQENFVKQYEIEVGDINISHTAIDGGVNVAVKFVGEAGAYKLINAVYNVLEGGALELVSATPVDVTKTAGVAYENNVNVNFNANQIVKTFFWKWDSLTPVANAVESRK